MSDYEFNKDSFIIKDFDIKKAFYSFLPGIAGIKGIPIWNFFLNRGQAIASFGTRDKNYPILEFNSSITAVQNISTKGFRTFLKLNGQFHEPFSVLIDRKGIMRTMHITQSGLKIEEYNESAGYRLTVSYGTLPSEDIGGLIRSTKLTNTSPKQVDIDLLDGITMVLPYGLSNGDFKNQGNLLRSWTDVYNLEDGIVYSKQRSSTADCAEVVVFDKGNFYISFVDEKQITPIADADLIFGSDLSHRYPLKFLNGGTHSILEKKQVTANKIPCGFTPFETRLEPGQSLTINTIIGCCDCAESVLTKKSKFSKNSYFKGKLVENDNIIGMLTSDIETSTAYPLFDGYMKQSYLDNLLRGGYPVLLDNKTDGVIYYLYSRKHGDMERDYNWFSIAPEFFSQGNGAYRDINQNRRNDVYFNPFIKAYNIRQFLSLIQLDGYNPLEVKGATFELLNLSDAADLAGEFAYNDAGLIKELLGKFTPGSIINYLCMNSIKAIISYDELLTEILSKSKQNIEAQFGEGYWVDHWTYIYDLIESFEGVYPDKMKDLMFGDKTYRYFYSPVYVLPRDKKYILNKEGKPRQYAAIDYEYSKQLMNKTGACFTTTSWAKKPDGGYYETDMASKLFALALIKFSTLDSGGMGIEMEGDKVGWNDAMNGLAGLFGSSISESIELLRLLRFIQQKFILFKDKGIALLIEQYKLLKRLLLLLDRDLNDFDYWNQVSEARESFRLTVIEGICSGNEVVLTNSQITNCIGKMINKLEKGLLKAKALGNGVYPGYLVYDVVSYEMIKDKNGQEQLAHIGLPLIKVTKFKVRTLPRFLEAAARSFKIESKNKCKEQYDIIKTSNLYDKKLGLYKTCEDLSEESFEIGRIKQFTPGYLERESCFLHMAYKYLYGQLKAGLYDEFYEDIKTGLVAFMDPSVYGRSVLENSTFIVTTVNPDETVHGQGFFARLTGANAEVLSIWCLMMFGQNPFILQEGRLLFSPKPKIAASFFNQDNEICFRFLGKTDCVYVNPKRLDTYRSNVVIQKIVVYKGGHATEIIGGSITGEMAEIVRQNGFEKIVMYIDEVTKQI